MRALYLFLFFLFAYFTALAIENNSLLFIENKNQWPVQVLYKTDLHGGTLFLEKTCFTFNFYNRDTYKYNHQNLHFANTVENLDTQMRFHAYKIHFVNANPNSTIEHRHKSSHYYNFYIGNDSKKWASNVYAFSEITYQNIYPGTTLKTYSVGNYMKYDFIITPGNSPDKIKLFYEGTNGISLDKAGNLIVKTSVNTITEQKPYAYQEINGAKKEVECRFKVIDSYVQFVFPKGYNKKYKLIIDPVLIFASYSGSTADNFGMTATYDNDGNLYGGGICYNNGYPITLGAYDGTFNGTPGPSIADVTISKFNAAGSNLIYSTYLGGAGTETVHSLIVNKDNELYLYGATSSADFPTTPGAYDPTFNGGSTLSFNFNGTTFNGGTDIYVTKFNSTGFALLGSTYMGGSGNDGVNYNIWSGNYNNVGAYDSLTSNYGDQFRGEVMLDTLGNCYIATSTRSADFPILNGFQPVFQGVQDAVVFKLNSNLTSLTWSTFLGGSDKDAGYSLKVDSNFNVYVAGGTASSNFPTTGGTIQTTYQGGKVDAYVCKISANGNSLLTSTFLGTALYDQAFFVELDRFENVYVVGQSLGNFPIVNAPYFNANSKQFVCKLQNNLSAFYYSSIFGNGNGSINISPSAFLVDDCENVYVSGWGANILQNTPLSGMPVSPNAFQANPANGYDFYLIVFERDVQSLLYGSYFGGGQSQEHVDGGTSRFDKKGVVYQAVCAGCGSNDDFPTTPGSWSQINGSSNCNLGVFKFDFEIFPVADFSISHLSGCAPLTIQFTNGSSTFDYLWDFGNNDTTSQIVNPIKTYNNPGTYVVYLIVTDSICNVKDTAMKVITVFPPINQIIGNDTTVCDSAFLWAFAPGQNITYTWSTNNQFTDTINPNINIGQVWVYPTQPTTTYYVSISNGDCSEIDSITVTMAGVKISTNDTIVCGSNEAQIHVYNNMPGQILTYTWTPTNLIISGQGTSSPTVNSSSSAWFYVTVTNQFGCSATDSLYLASFGANTANGYIIADEDTLFGQNGTYLHAYPQIGNYTYQWIPPQHVTHPNIPNTYANPPQTTTFIVMITDSNGCSITREKTIYVFELVCGEPNVYIPNAFTPNKDGNNDILFVRGRNITEMHFAVFNRWGEKVFETTDQKTGWDGTYKGKEVDPAVFVYHLTVKCGDGQEYFKKGNVTVIR
ncbi:MAG: T9SS type B sorting domain-containing protein [Bacteroidetes bacterium]|nr:hypothetical protein [Bacteroidota bacterium]MBV6461590.1 hypothetical protein [Flavobacteriales bacterium]WKZ74070.1 MAG: gliding motility-associated C-terminal domain-containing protein [Vicingaceae bacterium]MCL4817204.1 gliding motility-associated C-terminal domain-containing protein [Flavobacteriales bacterium]NOG95841.1 T9SS type B sorting domain-containing protein [Bacteroidota bacterium]